MLGRLVTLCGSRYLSRVWRGTDAVLALGRADASTQTPAETAMQRYCILCTFAAETLMHSVCAASEVPAGASRLCTLALIAQSSPSLAHVSFIRCPSSAGARWGKEGEAATKVHATNAIWGGVVRTCPQTAGASLSPVPQSNFQPLRYGDGRDDVQSCKWTRPSRVVADHVCFRPATAA